MEKINKLEQAIVEKGKKYTAKITVKSEETPILIELEAEQAPYTVSNFINLANGYIRLFTTIINIIFCKFRHF